MIKTILLLPLIILSIVPSTNLSETNTGVGPCGAYIKLIDRRPSAEFRNFNFNGNVSGVISAYAVSILFENEITDITVFGDREKLKVNSTLWIIYKNDTSQTAITFDFNVQFFEHLQIKRISVNGDVVCSSETSSITEMVLYEDLKLAILTSPTLWIIAFISIVGVLASSYACHSLRKLMIKTDKNWYKLECSILNMERRLSANPNNQRIPLPRPPRGKTLLRQGTYIDLATYSCSDVNCKERFSSLIKALEELPEEAKVSLETAGYGYLCTNEENHVILEETEEEELSHT